MSAASPTGSPRHGRQISLLGLVLIFVAANFYSAFAAWTLPHAIVAHALATPLMATCLAMWWTRRQSDLTWTDSALVAIGCSAAVAGVSFAASFVIAQIQFSGGVGESWSRGLLNGLAGCGLPMVFGFFFGLLAGTAVVVPVSGVMGAIDWWRARGTKNSRLAALRK